MPKCPYCYSPTGDGDIICFNCLAALQFVTARQSTNLPREDVQEFEERTRYVNEQGAKKAPQSKDKKEKGFFSKLFK